MDQVSRPLQIALLAALGFAVLWFIALRPQGNSSGGSSAPATPAKAAPARIAPAKTPAAPAPVKVDTSGPGFAIGQSIGRNAANSGSFVSAPAAAIGLFFGSIVSSGTASVSATKSSTAKVSAPA